MDPHVVFRGAINHVVTYVALLLYTPQEEVDEMKGSTFY